MGSRGHPHQLGQHAVVQQGRFPAAWLPTHPLSGQGDGSSRDRVAWRPHAPKSPARDCRVGDPLGHEEFVKSQLRCKLQDHLQRIEAVPDLQCAWLTLVFCAAARANCFLRVVHPGSSEEFARQHDAAIWQVFLQLSNITGGHETRDPASLPWRH